MATNRVSLEPSVLKLGDSKEEDVLTGSRCKECGRYFFPARVRCGACAEPTTEAVELSKEGTLISYTMITRKPRYSLIEPPYILGEVEIPEGIRLYSLINSEGVDTLAVGQKARLDTVEVKKDEEGNSVIAYAFTPTR